MIYKLSRNTFVRDYGPYTYVQNIRQGTDVMFKDASCFFKWLTRTPIDKNEILRRIAAENDNVPMSEIQSDFDALLEPLVKQGWVLVADNENVVDTLDKTDFSYAELSNIPNNDIVIVRPSDYGNMPQCILGDYFHRHPTLFALQLDVTQACTERCVHCYVPEYAPIFLPYETVRRVICDFREMGGLQISFSGGECMMHPDFEKMLRFAREQDLIVTVLSNLTLCDEKKTALLKECSAFVQVSLYSMNPKIHDGITQREGSWDKTKSAIERLHAADVPMRISCPTMRQNFDGYIEVLKYAEELHISAQTDFIMMAKANHDMSNLDNRLSLEQTRTLLEMVVNDNLQTESEYFDPKHKENLKSAEDRSEEPLCGAGVDKLCLNANGNYYPCSGFQDYPVGNCFKQSLRDVWENSPQLKYVRGLRGKDIPKCIHCENRNYCSMCLVRNFNETGDMLEVADHFCKVAALNRTVVEAFHQRLQCKNKA